MSLDLVEISTIVYAESLTPNTRYKPWGFGKLCHSEVHFHSSYIDQIDEEVKEKVYEAVRIILRQKGNGTAPYKTDADIEQELARVSDTMFISYHLNYNEIGFSYISDSGFNRSDELLVSAYDYVDLDDGFYDFVRMDRKVAIRDKWMMVKPDVKDFDYMQSVQRTIEVGEYIAQNGINNVEMSASDWERLVVEPLDDDDEVPF
jgi:hypothetical protein